jgi:hypothetical protein
MRVIRQSPIWESKNGHGHVHAPATANSGGLTALIPCRDRAGLRTAPYPASIGEPAAWKDPSSIINSPPYPACTHGLAIAERPGAFAFHARSSVVPCVREL